MNPYSPPTSNVARPEPANKRPLALVILGLAVLQCLWFLLNIGSYFELVRTGAASVFIGIGGLVGCILLYAGAARFAFNSAKGNRLFFASAVFLLLSLRGWGVQYFWSYPYILAAAVAIAGWWFSRRRPASI
jgi:hypothetical protein